MLLGIPLTKSEKKSKFYYSFQFKNQNSTAILSQIRLFDSKRIFYSIGRMSKGDFRKLKEKLIELIQ